jgi:ADP-ribosylglycohydrolase
VCRGPDRKGGGGGLVGGGVPGGGPEALTCALEATDFEDALRNAVSLAGDADTLAAIAGGLAEVLYGIPEAIGRSA